MKERVRAAILLFFHVTLRSLIINRGPARQKLICFACAHVFPQKLAVYAPLCMAEAHKPDVQEV
jgi:hypothetical protein